MTDKKTKRLGKIFLVIKPEVGGEVEILYLTAEQITEYAEQYGVGNFAVIDGHILKGFGKRLDPEKLR